MINRNLKEIERSSFQKKMIKNKEINKMIDNYTFYSYKCTRVSVHMHSRVQEYSKQF